MSNEISTVANDSYMFYLSLNKITRDAIVETQEAIKSGKDNIAEMEKRIAQSKDDLQLAESGLALLKQKELDIQGIISELEKNKAQFKNIVTGTKR